MYYSSLQCHISFRNHFNMLNWCSRNISYYTRFVLFNIFEETFLEDFYTKVQKNSNYLKQKSFAILQMSLQSLLINSMHSCWIHGSLLNTLNSTQCKTLHSWKVHCCYVLLTFCTIVVVNSLISFSSVLSQITSFVLLLLQKQKSIAAMSHLPSYWIARMNENNRIPINEKVLLDCQPVSQL